MLARGCVTELFNVFLILWFLGELFSVIKISFKGFIGKKRWVISLCIRLFLVLWVISSLCLFGVFFSFFVIVIVWLVLVLFFWGFFVISLLFPEFPTQLNFHLFKSWNSAKKAENWGCLPCSNLCFPVGIGWFPLKSRQYFLPLTTT